jgi:SAM-dependent methyltransferase
VADAIFEDRRLAEIYDPLDPDRRDLDAYVALVDEFRALSVLDIVCGTGTLACLWAQRGKEVTAVDPAAASIDVARRKPYADRVHWVVGDAAALPPTQVDLVSMTGNVAQVFLTTEAWAATLKAAHGALRPGGLLVFEVRDPAKQAWREWDREDTYRRLELPSAGVVETWTELTQVALPCVSFRTTFIFEGDGAVLISASTLRFRDRSEVASSLETAHFAVEDVRDAPDRPGREFVFIAKRRPSPGIALCRPKPQ